MGSSQYTKEELAEKISTLLIYGTSWNVSDDVPDHLVEVRERHREMLGQFIDIIRSEEREAIRKEVSGGPAAVAGARALLELGIAPHPELRVAQGGWDAAGYDIKSEFLTYASTVMDAALGRIESTEGAS